MVPNKILERAKNGEKALGLSLTQADGELVELAGRMGLDFVGLDGQHSPITPAAVGEVCRIAEGYGMTVTMRIKDGLESTILSYLDRGVGQIVVPNLLTKEEAEALVKYTFFAPLGLRSATSIPAMYSQFEGDHVRQYQYINENTSLVPQLESITSLENLDEILTVEGIDYFAKGPEDMAQSLGLPGEPEHPKAKDAYEKIDEKLRAAGKGWTNDIMESASPFMLTKGALEELLEKHGRKSNLGW